MQYNKPRPKIQLNNIRLHANNNNLSDSSATITIPYNARFLQDDDNIISEIPSTMEHLSLSPRTVAKSVQLENNGFQSSLGQFKQTEFNNTSNLINAKAKHRFKQIVMEPISESADDIQEEYEKNKAVQIQSL